MSQIMTPEEAERFLFEVSSATLAGRKPDLNRISNKTYARKEDMLAATEKLKKFFFETFDLVPEKISSDLRIQEIIRGQVETAIMESFAVALAAFGHELPRED